MVHLPEMAFVILIEASLHVWQKATSSLGDVFWTGHLGTVDIEVFGW